MEIYKIFAALSLFFSAIAYVPYVKNVLGAKAKPTISTWIAWGSMDVVILLGMWAEDAVAWQMLAYIAGAITVIATSLYRGASMGWTGLDSFCLVSAGVAMMLWWMSGNPNVAIVFSLSAFIVGSIPMIRNLWKDPSVEMLLPWVLFLVGGTFGVASIEEWTIAGALAPVTFMILQVLMVILILRRFRGEEVPSEMF